MGCPIRKSTDQRSLPPPRGLSQGVTSFIATLCQGIHRTPLRRLFDRKSSHAGENADLAVGAPRASGLAVRSCGTQARPSADPSRFDSPLDAIFTHQASPPADPRRIDGDVSGLICGQCTFLHDGKEPRPAVADRLDAGSARCGRRRNRNSVLARTASRNTDVGGAGRDRTDDLLLAKQALSQLSYSPGEGGPDDPMGANGGPGRI
jgi:hypothetical protein